MICGSSGSDRLKNPEFRKIASHGQFKNFKMGHYPLTAILDKPGGQNVCVTIPVGAMLVDSPHTSTTLVGMVGVYWEGQHYSVIFRDLLKSAEIVQSRMIQPTGGSGFSLNWSLACCALRIP